jgi:hypothetical protein
MKEYSYQATASSSMGFVIFVSGFGFACCVGIVPVTGIIRVPSCDCPMRVFAALSNFVPRRASYFLVYLHFGNF